MTSMILNPCPTHSRATKMGKQIKNQRFILQNTDNKYHHFFRNWEADLKKFATDRTLSVVESQKRRTYFIY